MKYLWDTNIVIYFLQRQFPPKAEIWIDNLLSASPPAMSVITEIELLCWKTPSEKDVQILQRFVSLATILELSPEIKAATVALRKSYRIKLPDAIIGATAMVHQLSLITRNVKDFQGIDGLSCLNPFDI